MSYTIRDLCLDVLRYLIQHPKHITLPLAPVTRAKIRTEYNAENTPYDFDIDMLTETRVMDAQYVSWSDVDLQSLIDSTVPEDEDVSIELSSSSTGGGGQ